MTLPEQTPWPWQAEAFDRQREQRNRVENPAIWQKLTEIEAKLDHILSMPGRTTT